MAAFYWDDLLDFLIERRNVVAVVGRDLHCVKLGDESVSFDALLARRLAELLPESDAGDDLQRLIVTQLRRNPRKTDLTRVLKQAHDDLVARVPLPESLRLLAEIRDIPLFLVTTTDGLLARALREVRATEPRIVSASPSGSEDLPAGWAAGDLPTVFHLFGHIAATPGFALNDEDVLEFLWMHQTPERRPPRLFDLLRRSHILLLGNSFPDWFTRFFLRLMKGRRLSEELETIEALADETSRDRRDTALVAFLENFSHQTRIYDEGGAAEFVRELHTRWTARGTTHLHAPGEYAADDMVAGSVFISYTRSDYEPADRLWRALDAAGVDVWFDKKRLTGGDPFEEKIRCHIAQCDLFIPLVSQHTEARDEGFAIKEWHWAMKRAEGMTRKFIIPLSLDGLDPYKCENLPQLFRDLDIRPLARTGPTPEFVEELRTTLRQIRSSRRAA